MGVPGVKRLAPGVLRYRVADGQAVALGEVHTARRAGKAVTGRVLSVATPVDETGAAETDDSDRPEAAPAPAPAPSMVTVLVEPEAAAAEKAVPLLPQYRALGPVPIRAGLASDSTVSGTLAKGAVIIALSVKAVRGVEQVQFADGWVSFAAEGGKPQLELVGKRAPRNLSTGWKPRPPPTENDGRRMAPRRLREVPEQGDRTSATEAPAPPVDLSGWEPRDGSAKPIIDAYLANAPTAGRTALTELKIMEKRELEVRIRTKRKMDEVSSAISRVLKSWDKLFTETSTQTPTDARLLIEGLQKNSSERNAKVDDLGDWHKSKLDYGIAGGSNFRGEKKSANGQQQAEDPLHAGAKVVTEDAASELVREQNRVRKLREMMSELAEQLLAVKQSVRDMNSEMKKLQKGGMESLHYYQGLVKGLKGGIEVAGREIKKATDHLRDQEQLLQRLKDHLAKLEQTRKDRLEWHTSEMESLRKLLERMKQKHLKELETMEQVHLDKLDQMRREVQELIEKGVTTPGLDMDALAQEANRLLADKGLDVNKKDLQKQLQDIRNQHAHLESDFMMHSAEEQDLIAQRDNAEAKLPATVAKPTEEDPLRALWRANKGAFRDWQRSCRRAEKRPAIGTQTMEVLKAPSSKLQPLEYMEVPDRPAIKEPEAEAEPKSEPDREREPAADPEPEPNPDPEVDPEADPEPELAPLHVPVSEPEPEPESEPEPKPVSDTKAQARAVVRVQKKQRNPTPLAKPKTPKKFVRKRIEKEKTQKYQPPPKPERVLQAPKSVGFALPAKEREESQSEAPPTSKNRQVKQERGPQKRILTSGNAKKPKPKVKEDPTKATRATVGLGGIQSSASEVDERVAPEKEIEPDWDCAWKIIWTSMQINRSPHNFSFIDVDEAFEVEDVHNDGMIGKKALGRGLRRLQIKLQSAELNSVHSAISPTSPTLDYESFARELYMRMMTATGVEREQTKLVLNKRVRKHPEEKKKEAVPWQTRIWKPLRSLLLSRRDIGKYSLADIHAAFHLNDAGKDGQLGIEEVSRGFNQLGISISDSQLQFLFNAVDVEKTGYISYPELSAEIHKHIQEIIEQDPVAQQKIRKKKEAQESQRRAAAKKLDEQLHGLMAELKEQNRQEEKSIKRIQCFLQQTEANIASVSDDVAKRGGSDAVLGRSGQNRSKADLDAKLESLRAARDEAKHMLGELLKTHERTQSRVAEIQKKTKAAQEALGLDADANLDASGQLSKTAKMATKLSKKTKKGKTEQRQRATDLTKAEDARQAEVAAAMGALFDAVEVDSSGRATVQELIAVLESGQQGEWTKFTDVFAEQLRAAAAIAPTQMADAGVRTDIRHAADRTDQMNAEDQQDPNFSTDYNSSDDGLALRQAVKLDRNAFMQMVASTHADVSAQVAGTSTDKIHAIPDDQLLTSPSDGILEASATDTCSRSSRDRSGSWPGASALPSERDFPSDHFSYLHDLSNEENGAAPNAEQQASATADKSTTEQPVTPTRKLRTFKLTVSINQSADEDTEIEVRATDINDLQCKVKKELRLDDDLDIRLSAEVQSTLQRGASPKEIRSLSQLPSPARIQVWRRDEIPFDTGILEMATLPSDITTDGPMVEESQSMPLLGTANFTDDETFESDGDTDNVSEDELDDESHGEIDLSELRATFSAVEAASSRQTVKLEAAERKTQATVQETIFSLAGDSAAGLPTQQSHSAAAAAKHGSAVFTDPSAPVGSAEALENALRPVTAPQHLFSGFSKPHPPQQFSGSRSWRDAAVSQRELARQQDEHLTALAEALRTPPTSIEGFTLSASAFPTQWSGVEVASTQDRGYVPIRQWQASTTRTQTRLASLGTGTAESPVVVHSTTHNGYVLGQSKLGTPGRTLRLRPSTSSAARFEGPSSSRSALPPVWSSGSLATLVPSLPAEPVSKDVTPHAVFLSASPGPLTPRGGLRPIGSAVSNHMRYKNMPNSAPTRGSKANFRFSVPAPLQHKVI